MVYLGKEGGDGRMLMITMMMMMMMMMIMTWK